MNLNDFFNKIDTMRNEASQGVVNHLQFTDELLARYKGAMETLSRFQTALLFLATRDGWQETIIPKWVVDTFPANGETLPFEITSRIRTLDSGDVEISWKEKDEEE